MKKQLLCGAAVRDITPEESMFPMESMFGTFDKAIDASAVRAIAIGDGDSTVLMMSYDMAGVPDVIDALERLPKLTELPVENILLFGTHAHATNPPLQVFRGGEGFPAPAPLSANEQAFLEKIRKSTDEAAKEALAAMKPAKMYVGYSESYININRNQQYSDGWMLGANPEGPSDKTATSVRFEDEAGTPIAFIFHYAVHAVVMHQNACCGEHMAYSSDLPGWVSSFAEKKYPGAVAMWLSGAAGDQNPIFMNAPYYPCPVTGEFRATVAEGGDVALLKVISARHFADLLRANEAAEPVNTNSGIYLARKDTTVPGRKVVREPGAPRHSKPIGYEPDKDFHLPEIALTIGDLALCCLGCELFTTLGWAIEDASPLTNTLVVTHCRSDLCPDHRGYIPDDKSIARETFGGMASFQPGYMADTLASTFAELMNDR